MAAPMEDVKDGIDLHSSLSLLCKNHWGSKEDVSTVNRLVRVSSTRCMGFIAMRNVVAQCDEQLLVKDGAAWLQLALATATSVNVSESLSRLAAENFDEILKKMSKSPESSRELSSGPVNHVLNELLNAAPSVQRSESFLISLESVMRYFPGHCGKFKGKITKSLSPTLLGLDGDLRERSARCWSRIAVVGGGGVGGRGHGQQWVKQMEDALDALDHGFSSLYEEDPNEELLDPALLTLSLHFPPVATEEPQRSDQLTCRFVALCDCMISLLQLDVSLTIEIPFDRIFTLVISTLNVSPKQLGFTSEMIVRSSYLSRIHSSCLKLLDALINQCSSHITRHSTMLNQTFLRLLTLWRDPSPSAGAEKLYSDVRLQIYSSIAAWIKRCGRKSHFLIGDMQTVQSQLDTILDDVSPQLSKIDSRGGGLPGGRDTNNVVNWELCSKALEATRLTVFALGPQLPSFVHKTLQEFVISVSIKLMQRDANIAPYSGSPSSRLQLYHLLLALTLSTTTKWPGPLQYSTQIFTHGSNHDASPDIRSFCVEATTTLIHICHPQAAPMHRVSVDYAQECRRQCEVTQPAPLPGNPDKPTNLPLHSPPQPHHPSTQPEPTNVMVVDDSPTATPVDISTSHVVDAEEGVEDPSYYDVTSPTIDDEETHSNEDEARMSPSMGEVGVSISKDEAGVNPRMGEGRVSPSKYEVGAILTSGKVGEIPGTTKVGGSDNIVKDKFSDNVGLDDKLGKLSQRTDREVEIMLLDFVDAPAEY